MPATNPRISVTVPPSVEAVLSRLSALTGQSKSSFVAELLEGSMPVLERMAIVIDAASKAKKSLKEQTLKDLEAGEAKLHELLGVTMDIFDEHTAPILEQAERVQRRTKQTVRTDGLPAAKRGQPARPKPAAQPPYVTRGSGTPKRDKGAKAESQKQTKAGSSSPKKTAAKGSKRAVEPSKKKIKG